MIAVQRQKIILEELEAAGSLVVDETSRRLSVAPVTVRRDFSALVKGGRAARVRGGIVAIAPEQVVELPYNVKHTQRLPEKRRIAALAAGLVEDGQAVILDGGTTTAEIAASLRSKHRLSIITTNLRVMAVLANHSSHTVITPGGILRPGMYEFGGPALEAFFRTVQVDYAFIGADAIDLRHGIMSASMIDPPVKRAMIAASRYSAVVADSAKFGHRALAQVCGVHAVTGLITDTALDQHIQREMTAADITLHLA